MGLMVKNTGSGYACITPRGGPGFRCRNTGGGEHVHLRVRASSVRKGKRGTRYISKFTFRRGEFEESCASGGVGNIDLS